MTRPTSTCATPADAVRLGADAFATCAFVRGASEAAHLRRVADFVRDAERLGMPVIVHTYPRRFPGDGCRDLVCAGGHRLGGAVRGRVRRRRDQGAVLRRSGGLCADRARMPAAGGRGRWTEGGDAQGALSMAAEVVASGAKGMTVGRNIWGFPQVGPGAWQPSRW